MHLQRHSMPTKATWSLTSRALRGLLSSVLWVSSIEMWEGLQCEFLNTALNQEVESIFLPLPPPFLSHL